jgi:acetyl esterase/lipase
MRKYILFLSSFITVSVFAQDAAELYRKADTLFRQKDYTNSAMITANGIRAEGQSANVGRYRFAAAAWSLAGNADSAFHNLNLIAVSDKANKVVARNIEYGEDFIPVNKDKRWQPVVAKIKKQADINGYPQEEFIYGRKDGIGLTLVWIKPKVKSNGKAIISVQSGSWISSFNGIEVSTPGFEQYLKKGYNIFAVYHGSQPRYAIPDAFNDLKRSVRYIRYNAAKFGIDPDHIGITGGSAGGHLSLLVATANDKINPIAPDPIDRVSSRVQAVAILFPPTDFFNWGALGNVINNALAKQLLQSNRAYGAIDFKTFNPAINEYEQVTDTAQRNKIGKEISPIYAVTPDDPPVFIIHGDADPTVPLQQSELMIAKLKEAGVPNRFIIKKGGKHNGDDMNPEWQEFADWFDKYLK